MLKKPNVLCDIDGVCADCMGPMYYHLSQRGFDLDPARNTNYFAVHEQLQEVHGLSAEEAETLLGEIFWGKGFMLAQPVRLDAVRALPLIVGIANEVHMVTARDTLKGPHVIAETMAWLETYAFPHHTLAFEKDKITYCREKKMSYVIEDAPHTAEKAHRHGYGVFLVNAPYNQEITPRARLWRVDALTEIPPIMEADWAAISLLATS